MAIVKGAGLVMRALIEEGELEMSTRMQDLALSEGALPRHLLTAVFTSVKDGRQLANRQLSRHLVGLWISGHCTALGLLKRILVLLSFLFIIHVCTYDRLFIIYHIIKGSTRIRGVFNFFLFFCQ